MTKFNLSRFIKIAVVVTLFLAVVEVIIIFVLKEKKAQPFIAHKTAAVKEIRKDTVADSSTMQPSPGNTQSDYTQANNSTSPEPYDTVLQKQKTTPPVPSETAQPTTFSPAKVDSPKQKSNVARAKAVTINKEKKTGRNLSAGEMNGILNDVNAERKRLNISAKCVQIQKTGDSNVDNAFAVAEFLRSYGFIISGRRTIPATQPGIKLDTDGQCIVVSIGKL